MKQKGFTIIELIITIAILGIILSVTVPGIVNMKATQDSMEITAHEEQLNKYIRQYYVLMGEKFNNVDQPESAFVQPVSANPQWIQDLANSDLVSLSSVYKYTYTASGLYGHIQVTK